MAQFDGTIKEFTKFVGPYARLKVAFMAAKYKKLIGKCEDCGEISSLDAAHVKGKGRALLIANILSEFIEDDIIKIDLTEFEERYVDAHLPIETAIRVLCKPCHRIYDKENIGLKETSKKASIAEETALIESLINNQMNKSKAMKHLYSKGFLSLTNTNTIFSNIIDHLNSWWLQPENNKFNNELHIILNDKRTNKFYFFKILRNTIDNPPSHFKQRNDKYRQDCSDIYIPTSGTKFSEKNGFDFNEFLVDTIEY